MGQRGVATVERDVEGDGERAFERGGVEAGQVPAFGVRNAVADALEETGPLQDFL